MFITNAKSRLSRFSRGLITSGKKIALCFIAVVFWVNGFTQVPGWLWAKGIGGTSDEEGNSIAVDESENVYTIGYFNNTVDFDPGAGVFNLTSAGVEDIFISKLDSLGNFVWAKRMGGSNYDRGYSIAADGSGSVYAAGFFSGTVDFDPGPGVFNLTAAGTGDIFLLKLTTSGNFVWAKKMGGNGIDEAFSMALDASANIYITGFFEGTADFDPGTGVFNLTVSTNSNDLFISKLDSSGNFVWAKAVDGTGGDRCSSLAVDTSGNVCVTGFFSGIADFDPGASVFNLTSTGNFDVFILKLDNAGNFIWAKAIGGTDADQGASVAVDGSGNVYTTGAFAGTCDFDPGTGVFNLSAPSAIYGDIFISKLDASGNFVWAKSMGAAGYDGGFSIAVDASHNVYTTGFRGGGTADFDPGPGIFNLTSAGDWDIFLLKLDSSGNFMWARGEGGAYKDRGNSLALNPSHNVFITGYFNSDSVVFGTTTLYNGGINTHDIFVAKLDSITIITENNKSEGFDNGISLSPIPATNELRIEAGQLKIDRIEIFNSLGKKVFKSHISNLTSQFSVDVSHLLSGIYIVKAIGEKIHWSGKFVKE